MSKKENKKGLTMEEVANMLVAHLVDLIEENPNDKDLGAKTRDYLQGAVQMRRDYRAHDEEIKKLMNEN